VPGARVPQKYLRAALSARLRWRCRSAPARLASVASSKHFAAVRVEEGDIAEACNN
jgi:hypothetical protein